MKSTLHKISRKFCQRELERFSIAGATVSWAYTNQDSFPDETSPLSDISRHGLSFLTNNPPTVDSDIVLWVNLPKQPERLELQGRTIYAILRGPNLTYEYRVGVKLKPYSENDGDISTASQEVIAELEQTYGKRMDKQEDIED